MADPILITIAAVDTASNIIGNVMGALGTLGNVITGIKSAVDLMSDAWDAAAEAVAPFVESAMESEVALSNLDVILRSTSGGAGLFQETVGRLSNEQLAELYEKLEHAKDKLEEMKDEFGNAKTYTDQETVALAAQREEIAQLTAAIERGTEGLVIYRDTTQLSRDALLELAQAKQLVTQYSDEEVLAAEAMMLRFENVNSKIFPEAIALSADLAQVLGIELVSAARMIGVALDDPEQGIGRLNNQFRIFNETELETIKNMAANGQVAEAQGMILDRLSEKVGGAAEAFGETFAGQVEIAKNKLDEMRETIGGPIMTLLGQLLDKVMEFAETNPVIQAVLSFFTRFNELLQTGELPLLNALGIAVMQLGNVYPILRDIGYAIVVFGTALEKGATPLEAFKKALEDLKIAWNDSPLEPILDRLLEFINTGETEGWGQAFQDLFDDIWAALNITQRIQGLLNTAATEIEKYDWSAVGATVGRVLSGALNIALGIFLVGLPQLIDSFDWAPVGLSLKNALMEALKGAFASDTDSGIAQTIQTAVQNEMASGNVFEIASLSFGVREVSVLLSTTAQVAVAEEFKKLGIDAGDGFKLGLALLFAPGWAYVWIMEHVVEPIKRALGIASPSTVFKSIGMDVVRGLIDGITSMFPSLDVVVTNLWNRLFGGGNTATGGASATFGGFGQTGTVGGRNMGDLTTSGVLTGGTVTNIFNFYGTVYMSGVGPEGTYDCPPSPLLSSQPLYASGYR